jgi:LysM repeat protein
LKLDDYIYPGQTLLIPKKNVSYYITKDGDTLYTVSNIFGITEKDVVDQNKTIYLLPEQMIYYKKQD